VLLEGKNAVVYGAGGSIGEAVSRAFAREGATVYLAGRTQASLDVVAGRIHSAGGRAETAVVDALDETAVDEHADAVAARAGTVDISFNLGGLQVAFGAVEAFRRSLARELGSYGIRVLTLQTGGIPESIIESFEGRDAIVAEMVGQTMLGRAATLDDVGNVAAFAASDYARSMTATALNITCGTEVD
jgi:3-oxoacyl-[acyl-carrier protein] reductase